jgi:curli biogenesis system outer membrane secretion channel CsgG
MRRRTVALLLVAGALSAGRADAQEPAARPTLAIADIHVQPGGWTLPPPQIGTSIVEMMMGELVGARRFQIYDGQWLVPDSESGHVDLPQLRRAAADRGVDYVVVGTVTSFSTEQKKRRFGGLLPLPFVLGGVSRQQATLHVTLSFRIVDVRTGEVVTTAEGDGSARRRSIGGGGFGFVHGVPVGALASAATAKIGRDAMLNDALRQAVHTAALSLSASASRLAHTAQ